MPAALFFYRVSCIPRTTSQPSGSACAPCPPARPISARLSWPCLTTLSPTAWRPVHPARGRHRPGAFDRRPEQLLGIAPLAKAYSWDEGPDRGGPPRPTARANARGLPGTRPAAAARARPTPVSAPRSAWRNCGGACARPAPTAPDTTDQVAPAGRQRMPRAGCRRGGTGMSSACASRRTATARCAITCGAKSVSLGPRWTTRCCSNRTVATRSIPGQCRGRSFDGITHVIRGEEWLRARCRSISSALIAALGWTPPEFAHLLLRNPDKSKLSKRRNPTSILYYRQAGFLPEALINYLGLMAYSFADGREIFTLAEMAEHFEIDRISLGGPVFDFQKLQHFNGRYLRSSPPAALWQRLQAWLLNDAYWQNIIPPAQPRLNQLADFVPQAAFLFADRLDYPPALLVQSSAA